MFKGKFYHTLDAKNRTIVPSKLRDELGDTFVITVGLEGCLYIYPNDEWEVFAEELKKLPGAKDARDLRRKFMSNATDCDTDRQGRFLIPAELCEEAGLVKDVVFSGNINKIELWSKERWEKVDSAFGNMDDIADKMAEYGISF